MTERTFSRNTHVSASQAGTRLDLVLSEIWDISRRESRALSENGLVLVNGRVARRGLIVKCGDLIQVGELSKVEDDRGVFSNQPKKRDVLERELERVHLVYEDSDMVVLGKPRMMHSVSLRAKADVSLADCAIARYPEMSTAEQGPDLNLVRRRVEGLLVQRLDYFTSGVVLAGRSIEIQQKLSAALRRGEISKSYLALLSGDFSESNRVVDREIFIVPDAKRVFLEPQGNRSRCFNAYSVFSSVCKLESLSGQRVATVALIRGEAMRRHQVRVHAQYLGYPLVGDSTYHSGESSLDDFFPTKVGAPPVEGFLLHALSLVLQHPRSGSSLKIVDTAHYLADWLWKRGVDIWSPDLLSRI